MVRFNTKVCKRSKSNGMAKHSAHQGETFRGSSEAESFIGSTTSATITRITKGVAQFKKRNKR